MPAWATSPPFSVIAPPWDERLPSDDVEESCAEDISVYYPQRATEDSKGLACPRTIIGRESAEHAAKQPQVEQEKAWMVYVLGLVPLVAPVSVSREPA